MSDNITRTTVEENESKITKLQVQNEYNDKLIRKQVRGLHEGHEPVITSLNVTENGTYSVEEGTDGFNPVVVNVPEPVITSLNVTKNGTYSVEEGTDGFNPVVVNVPATIPDEILTSEFDFVYNKTNNLSAYTDKINGEQSTQSERSIELDDDGYMQFNNTNGFLWIPQGFGFNKCYRVDIEIIGKSEYIDGDGNNILKLYFDNNHTILQWDNTNGNWKLQDWSGHDSRLNEPFTYFNNKKISIYYGCGFNNGTLTKTGFMNKYTMYDSENNLILAWEEVGGQTANSIRTIGIGHNSACKNYKFKSIKIYQLNNVTGV